MKVQKLAARGVRALVAGPDSRGFYRVRTAELSERQAAERLRQRLAQQGFKGVIGTTP